MNRRALHAVLLMLMVIMLGFLNYTATRRAKELNDLHRNLVATYESTVRLQASLDAASQFSEAEHDIALGIVSKHASENASINFAPEGAAHRNIGSADAKIAADLPVGQSVKPEQSGQVIAAADTARLVQPSFRRTDSPQVASFNQKVVPVLVFACKRAQYLDKTLKTLLEHMPHHPETDREAYEIWVSQDGTDASVHDLVTRTYPQVRYLQHIDHSALKKDHPGDSDSYYLIARHYGWAFGQIFEKLPEVEHVIVLEEDIEVAPDFFEYMEAGAALMRKDSSLWTVTAWNDNGFPNFSHDSKRLFRSDFFAGLGWIMTRSLWLELEPKWPRGYWDDWMRLPSQRKGRACIRPEVSRTKTFGKEGASHGQFFDSHLSKMVLNRFFCPRISTC